MKVHARMKDLLYSTRGATVLFDISNYQHQQYLLELEQDVDYTLEIKKVKSKRSLEQNALLWKLLHMLEIKSREEAMDWYIKALIETGAKCTYIAAPQGSEKQLMLAYRAVQQVCTRLIVNPETKKETEGIMYRCFIGSSKMSVEEMTNLIETVLRYCQELGIQTEVL